MNGETDRKTVVEKLGKPPERIVYLDLLRITAIFAMMWLHVSASGWEIAPISSFQWQVFNIYDSAVRFCVPVFVMVSGVMFLDNSRSLSVKRLFRRNILRILTAFFFWSAAYAVGHVAFDAVTERRVGPWLADWFFEYLSQGHYHLWFLFTIIGLYFITPFLRKISSERKLVEYFLVLSFLFCFVGNLLKLIPAVGNYVTFLLDTSHFHFVLGYTGYYFLGYYLHRYGVDKRARILIYVMAVFSFLFTVVGTRAWVRLSGKPHLELYGELLPTTFFVSCGVFLLFKERFSKVELRAKTFMAVQRLSALSFGMYLIHDLFRMLLIAGGMSRFLISAPIPAVPIITGIVFLCSLFSAMAIHKIPVLNRYIM